MLFGGAVLVALHDWLGLGGSGLDSAVNGPLYDAVVVSAGLACLVKARGAGRERGAWLAIAAAVLCWGASEIYWTAFLANDPSPPYPSPADIGYLAFYPLAATGVYLLVRARARELDWRLWMDGADRRARHRGPRARRSSSSSSPTGPPAPRSRSPRPSPIRSATS